MSEAIEPPDQAAYEAKVTEWEHKAERLDAVIEKCQAKISSVPNRPDEWESGWAGAYRLILKIAKGESNATG